MRVPNPFADDMWGMYVKSCQMERKPKLERNDWLRRKKTTVRVFIFDKRVCVYYLRELINRGIEPLLSGSVRDIDHIAHLYMVAKASQEESGKNAGEGVEIVRNEPYGETSAINKHNMPAGQYT